jgi:hypothetical protein
MKKYILFIFLLVNVGCVTTKEYYPDDVYYSNPRNIFEEYNYRNQMFWERQFFPQFYYGYPYVPFDFLIQQPYIKKEPRKVYTPKQPNQKIIIHQLENSIIKIIKKFCFFKFFSYYYNNRIL